MSLKELFLAGSLTMPLASCVTPEKAYPECGENVSVEYILDKWTLIPENTISVKGAKSLEEEICARSAFWNRNCQAVIDGKEEPRTPLVEQDPCLPSGQYVTEKP